MNRCISLNFKIAKVCENQLFHLLQYATSFTKNKQVLFQEVPFSGQKIQVGVCSFARISLEMCHRTRGPEIANYLSLFSPCAIPDFSLGGGAIWRDLRGLFVVFHFFSDISPFPYCFFASQMVCKFGDSQHLKPQYTQRMCKRVKRIPPEPNGKYQPV